MKRGAVMLKLNGLQPPEGFRHSRKRVGRGIGSGLGKTSTKGHKGQKARAGGGVRLGFEGGQIPLQRRIPKIGFRSLADKARTAVLDVQILSRFDNDVFVTLDLLKSIGVVGKQVKSVKLIGNAALFNRLTLDKGIALSRGARESLLQQGGAARSE